MQQLARYIEEAKTEQDLQQLSLHLQEAIPFNKPHRFTVRHLSPDRAEVHLPYVETNLNHVQGLHACALATAAELATGLLVLFHFTPSQYRILLESMHVAYHYQGRRDAVGTCTLDLDWLRTELLPALAHRAGQSVPLEGRVHDAEGRHLCTASVRWHVKRWDRVRRPTS